MRSGHQGRAWLAWAVLCAGLCVTTVRAQAPVVCAGLDDTELLARIRGQTRDLPIVLIRASAARVPRPTAAALQAIAREYKAEFVVSVNQEPSGARAVYVFDARAAELRVRTAPAPDRKRFARSAAAETVALIVRGELADALSARASESSARDTQNIPSGGASAVTPTNAADVQSDTPRPLTATKPAASVAPEPKPAAAAAPEEDRAPLETDQTDQTDQADEPPDAARRSAGASFALGPSQLSLELAGRVSSSVTDRYFLGAAISLRVSFDYFSFGITGSSTLNNRADIQGLALTLREHGIGVDALAHLPLPASLRVGLGAAGRLLFYRRNAASADPGWQPEPANTTSSVAVGPQLELRWQLAQHLGVGIRIGLDVLLRPVSWRYRLDTNPRVPVELEQQSHIEPWLSLGVHGSL